MLNIQNLSIRLGGKKLLENANVHVSPRNRVGLIGRNGSGKSTLMRVLQKTLHPDEGTIDYPNDWIMACLDQELPNGNTPIVDYVCSGDSVWHHTMKELEEAEAKDDGHAIAHAHDILASIDGYSTRSRAETLLMGLGFKASECDQPINHFSGGWQMRSQLARVMMARSDLLLLDEPTNHLDLEAILYLEAWLKRFPGTAIIISHDREFLDNVCTHTIHLNQHRLRSYTGGVTEFMRQFEEAYELEQKMAKKVNQKRAHMQKFVDRFRAKASKAKQAQSRLKALEKMQFSAELVLDSECSFSFLDSKPVGWPAISIQGDCGYGDTTILHNIRWSAGAQDRIGIIGKNGAGKTTFLKTLMEELPLLNGKTEKHPDLRLGYFSQQQVDELCLTDTPLQALMRTDSMLTEQKARQHLATFYFDYQRVLQPIAPFSGGEKARLALSILIWQRPNFLLLDEPTNHLDMPMREALISALQSFPGAVILVSHDRHLLNCTVNQYYLVNNGSIQTYDLSLMDYAKSTLEKTDQATTKTKKVKSKKSVEARLEALDKKIHTLREKLSTIDSTLADGSLYDGTQDKRIDTLNNERKQLDKKIKNLTDEWEGIATTL